MTQLTFGDAEYAGKRKRTKRETFLAEMEQVTPWSALLARIEPVYPKAGRGRHPYPLETMLRIHLMQQWFGYSDPAMEEALYEIAPLRQFAKLTLLRALPDDATIRNFRRLLERDGLAADLFNTINAHLSAHGLLLRQGTMVDATIIHAPSSTKNRENARTQSPGHPRFRNFLHPTASIADRRVVAAAPCCRHDLPTQPARAAGLARHLSLRFALCAPRVSVWRGSLQRAIVRAPPAVD